MDAELVAWMQQNPAHVELWKLWGQTEDDRASIAGYFEECRSVSAQEAMAREIAVTDTREEGQESTDTGPAVMLFPIWESDEPMARALQVAVARAHLEAA